ncbi:CelD/BcsL family acetyltransferase involved in cellulose biosynthesis [Litorivivens lipolytica]|uniref:CelD/BcsL family acetyltransferase involved in cellulose biosynthesis n=1 Tax=Litorivivens lipolytica TaxID=1524264 RepID=A0A7W4W5H9_9GAMM|nr:GNAT family N-acetyltransferase [Litorivivens lipolytica]MBB3047827.1 CelD/BcsL family acetyltransferase involved in cellulose biosynthesis [Litorivivens lipolytica]
MLSTRIIDNLDELRSIRHEWADLLADSACNNLFLSWEWMHTWWIHMAENRELYVILVRLENELIGIAPLAVSPPKYSRLMPFLHLEFIASGNIGSDYLSFILRNSYEQTAMKAISQQITAKGYMVELTRVEEASSFTTQLPQLIQMSGGSSHSSRTNICPYIDIRDKTWQDYCSELSRTHQKYFMRKLRKLKKDFSVDFLSTTTEMDMADAMSEFFDLHLDHWRNRGELTVFNDPRIVAFHQDFSRIASDAGWLRLFRLRLDGVTAACVYQFRYLDSYYYFQSALNDSYTKYSVGMLTLGLSIQQAISEGVHTFDLLHDNEEYKYLWTDKERFLARLEVYPASFYGTVCRNLVKLKHFIRPPAIAYRRAA